MVGRLFGRAEMRVPSDHRSWRMRPVLIRLELPTDVDAIRAVHLAAFARPPGPDDPVNHPMDAVGAAEPPDPVEAKLVDDLRADAAAWIPELSFVAERSGEVVGHVVCTRGRLGRLGVLGLGPLGVLPAHQRSGVGTALMHAVLGAADALGEPLVALLGEPAYYRRFAFEPATTLDITPPVEAWGAYFQARRLTRYDGSRHRGDFAYAAAFDDL
jgi:putative acetyltransferase